MAPRQGRFRLGDLLCFTQQIPSAPGESAARLLRHMTHGYFNPWYMGENIAFVSTALCEQFPWLDKIHLPKGMSPHDWAMFWAWLDTKEVQYGVWHDVDPLTESELEQLWAGTQVTFEDEE